MVFWLILCRSWCCPVKAMRLRSNYGADIGYSCSLTFASLEFFTRDGDELPISSAALMPIFP